MAPAIHKVTIDHPAKEGWLEKQSRALKRWKKRWCVLQDNYLYTYADERGYTNPYTNPTEAIDLRVYSVCQLTPGMAHRFPNLTFELKGKDNNFPLAVIKEKEKEPWVTAIQRQIQLVQAAQQQQQRPPQQQQQRPPAAAAPAPVQQPPVQAATTATQ